MGAVRLAAVLALVLVGFGAGCRCSGNPAPDTSPTAQAPSTSQQGPSREEVVSVDLLQQLSQCAVLHRGVLLDLGSPSSDGRFDYSMAPPPGVTNVDQEGATWARISARSVSQHFVLDRDTPVFVQVRLRTVTARAATVLLDDKSLGVLRLPKDGTSVVSTAPTAEPVGAGAHVVTLQFHGVRKGQITADVDWIRVGIPDSDTSTYAAPTQRDLVIDTTIGDKPRRALALHAPGAVRCQVPIPSGAIFRTSIGYTGPGEGEAEIVLNEPGRPPAVLQTAKVGGESDAAVDVELPLDSFAGRVLDLELRATAASPGGRVLFGEPSIHLPPVALPPRDPTRIAIILVLSATAPSQLPPYSDVPALATLTDLATAGATFLRHRTNTTFAAGSIASLMTGLPPSVHTVVDGGARLPERIPTIGTMARDGRVTTAMFTGNPTTFSPFGFDRGWDRFMAFSPVSGAPAQSPLMEATMWLEKRLDESHDSRLLAFIHARGVHPPWAASTEEIRNLPPEEYSGPITARRGAQVLASLRAHKGSHLKPEDRQRIDGLCSLALVGEDQSLSQLIAMLRRARVWDKTLFIVTSDVALGSPSRIPFGEGTDLGEDLLDLPLIVHFPGERHAGEQVNAPTAPADVLATVLAALGLKTPETLRGRDLFEVATHPARFPAVPQVAELGSSYATRLGDFLLAGTSPHAPTLCLLNPMAECGEDLTTARPFLDEYLFQATYRYFQQAAATLDPAPARESATLDPDTTAALTVWGDLQSR